MKKMLPFLLVWLLPTSPAAAQPSGDHQFQFDNFLSEWVQGPDGAWFGVGWSRHYPGFPQASAFVIKWNPVNNQLDRLFGLWQPGPRIVQPLFLRAVSGQRPARRPNALGRLARARHRDRHCQTVSVIVSAEEPTTATGSVRVAPNPASDQTTFFLDAPEASDTPYQIVLTDAAGRVVRQLTATGPTWTLERDTLPAGLYLYQIAARHGVVGAGKIAFAR